MPANRIFHRLIGARMPHIAWAQSRPADAQRGVYLGLMHALLSTKYGEALGIRHRSDVAKRKDFVRRVPVVTYDELKPWIVRAMAGERHVLWPGSTKWFAQSSGTTNDQFKWLPVTSEALQECHYKGGKDVLAQFCHQVPQEAVSGKTSHLGRIKRSCTGRGIMRLLGISVPSLCVIFRLGVRRGERPIAPSP